jgi:hypothetical protein|tara:strand:+ start:15 stop:305 length:291 start_codon:yes stop_codon:yes gene_type:complete
MLVKLTEVCGTGVVTIGNKYTLREVFVNPKHVVMVREELHMRQLNEQGMISDGLNSEHRFSKLIINKGQSGSEIIVVGAPERIESILQVSKKVLRG